MLDWRSSGDGSGLLAWLLVFVQWKKLGIEKHGSAGGGGIAATFEENGECFTFLQNCVCCLELDGYTIEIISKFKMTDVYNTVIREKLGHSEIEHLSAPEYKRLTNQSLLLYESMRKSNLVFGSP